ncbi:flavodoxin domain-containing protein [Streptomyces sp. NPDC002896]|uniref:flavodoxin domain-containing protein n=1 Tax=Streptomyces sp. NPDC002896 TaxID=3154438 RepID=UPI003331F9FC
MKIAILYGTESGNAEIAAEDAAEALDDGVVEVEVLDMSTATLDQLLTADSVLVICSTHGEGDLPTGAQPFVARLDADKPDLTGVRYAMFGLGDRTYTNYSRGSEIVDEHLRALGAVRFGEYGRHDATGRVDVSDAVQQWAVNTVSTLHTGVGD